MKKTEKTLKEKPKTPVRERILVVEDEEDILELISYNLAREGYRVSSASSGEEGLRVALRDKPDLVVLDIMLPGIDGIEVCRRLKADPQTRYIPVVMVTAKGDEADVVTGLELGADDYLTKPFSVGELLARMRVALRQRGTTVSPAITHYQQDGLDIDLTLHRVSLRGEPLHLTPTEYKLLARLVRNTGQVVTHRALLSDVWGAEFTEHTHYLRLYMAQLRAKIELEPAEPRFLLTEPGVGYRLADS
jgi:two-component system KDP operon response regulator KdpE